MPSTSTSGFERRLERGVLLARHTTLELGGPARFFVRAEDETTVREAVTWSADRGIPIVVLGEGSNVVVSDRGFDGLVLRVATRGVETRREGDRVLVTAAAGERWDPFVERAVAEGLAGLECLSGIPGLVGATPIQNVGAYGQEVSDTIVSVRSLDRETGEVTERPAGACAFAYRDSVFKRDPSARHVVLGVTYALLEGGAPSLRHGELARSLHERGLGRPTLADVRGAVLALRRDKSMLIDPTDENRRSVGSFFTNPVVPRAVAERIVASAVADGLVRTAEEVPRHRAPGGDVKLAAAWLIEKAGVHKGERQGAVGVSSRHALALVHHGGGTTANLLALADRIRAQVRQRFGIELLLEPRTVGNLGSAE